jgi:meiotically up-regulated gene 157 (Mug157) protein
VELGNAMACVELGHLKEMLQALLSTSPRALSTATLQRIKDVVSKTSAVHSTLCESLAATIMSELSSTGVIPYEVDGYGGRYFMDDANVPSLLSLPLLGFLPRNSATYQATRSFVLSTHNPFYFAGSAAEGVGSPHQRGYEFVWPIAIIVRAMTSDSD